MIALDLGTRSIVCADVENFSVRRLAIREHPGRAVREGSIHNVDDAVRTLREIRAELNLSEGTEVAIAVAGRGLLSHHLAVTLAHDRARPWTPNEMHAAEESELAREIHQNELILLGAARSGFFNDGEPVSSLNALEGKSASYRLLATSLPISRLRAKMRVVEMAGLRPVRVTAEPLAIASALFEHELPPALFLLVDIGAGTSDIALIGPNGLRAVASIPVAGDTITDGISEMLSIGYAAADRIKRSSDAAVSDMWGEERKFTAEDIANAGASSLKTLVSEIGSTVDGMLEEIEDSPIAGTILVGGGSLFTGLPEALARRLKLPPDRVRVRAAETISGLADETGLFRGPALVTCAGMIRSFEHAFRIIRVRTDEETRIALLPGGVEPTVAETLEKAGLDPLDFFGDPGEALFENDRTLGGEPGGDPRVTLDGCNANLDARVGAATEIVILRGANGRDAADVTNQTPAIAHQILPERPAEVASEFVRRIVIGEHEYEIEWPEGLAACDAVNDPVMLHRLGECVDTRGFVTIDGHRVYCGRRYRFAASEAEDAINLIESDAPLLDSLVPFPSRNTIRVMVNDEWRTLHDRTPSLRVNERRLRAKDPVPWDAEISTAREKWFVFEAVADLPRAVVLSVNGRAAGYTTAISDEDRVTAS